MGNLRSLKEQAQSVFCRVENEFFVIAATFGTLIHSFLACPSFLVYRAQCKAHLFQQAYPDYIGCLANRVSDNGYLNIFVISMLVPNSLAVGPMFKENG